MSAGWHWQPVDHVKVFSLEKAMADSLHLDGRGLDLDTWADECSAGFTSDSGLVVVLAGENSDTEADDDETEREKQKARQPFGEFRVFNLNDVKRVETSYPQAKAGTIMPVGTSHAIGFYDYPKLFDLHTGAVIQSWLHLKSGKQEGSIIWQVESVPPIALDSRNQRFAIASEGEIVVVQLTSQKSEK